ncbi:hypothetical protein SUGI_0607590 [Cryptomeria japonica]|nr:hypothetical protein SUGI_0607590 [Cryptomeria japonica]
MAALQMSYAFNKLTSISEAKVVTANHSSKHYLHCGLPRKSRIRSLASSNIETAVPEPTENITPPTSPQIDFVFVSPEQPSEEEFEVQRGPATGGQKLRDIMLDNQLDLYGPYYNLPLLNCGGGGTCGTCIVEILQGQELLSERTDKEKEHLKKKPKTWRLACQTVVGNKDSVGKVVVQRLPEFKQFDWA